MDDYSFIPNEYGDVTIANYDAFIIVYAINKRDSIKVADTIKSENGDYYGEINLQCPQKMIAEYNSLEEEANDG